MIDGRFGNTTGRPYIEARLSLPRLRISAPMTLSIIVGDISFLADTGADRTTIMPLDGLRLAIPYAQLVNPFYAHGVGGAARAYIEPALISFLDQAPSLVVYDIDVLIQEPLPAMYALPSLLGRDIMRYWILNCDQTNQTLTGTPLYSDFVYPVPAGTIGLAPLPGGSPPPLHP
jgi:hypothetical protein